MSTTSARTAALRLWVHEMRLVARDRKTIFLSFVLPLLVLPLVLAISQWSERQREEVQSSWEFGYALVGDTDGELAGAIDASIAARPESVDNEFRRVQAEPGSSIADLLAHEDVVIVLEREAWTARPPDTEAESGEGDDATPERRPAQWRITIHYEGNVERSSAAASAFESVLAAARDQRRLADLRRLAVGESDAKLREFWRAEDRDAASAEDSAGASLGAILTCVLVGFIVMGGQSVAADLVAGERERGTLETLMVTPVSRGAIAWSKLATILCVSAGIAGLQLVNLGVYSTMGWLPGEGALAWAGPATTIVGVGLLIVPLAVLLAAALLWLSARAESFKAAQLSFIPLQILALIPPLAPMLPNMELRSAIIVVPMANVAVAVREWMAGRPDLLGFAAVMVVNVCLAVFVVRGVSRTLVSEDWLLRSRARRGQGASISSVASTWFWYWSGGLWAVLVIIAVNAAGLDVRVAVFINIVGIMGGGALAIIKIHRLDLREAWSLRAPAPAVWLAVLIGAPCGWVVAHGLFLASSHVIPVPTEMLEQFGAGLLPDHIPRWQLLILLSVTPGIFEELLFRGSLMHGASMRMPRWQACLVTSLLFGLFHVDLFRLVPTGCMGLVLGTVTLLSGSIFPAMLWHTLNNLIGVAAGSEMLGQSLPGWSFPVAGLGLACSLALVWRARRVDG